LEACGQLSIRTDRYLATPALQSGTTEGIALSISGLAGAPHHVGMDAAARAGS
jgi:hypothetical protein